METRRIQPADPRLIVTRGAIVLSACAAMALAAMAACGYRWGADDQAQYIVQLISIERPGVFAGDPYADVFGALGSLFWWPIAWLTDEASRGSELALLTLAITLASALLLYAIGRTLLGSAPRARWLALLAPLLLVVPKELNWFGIVSLSDVELTASLGVMPLVFASLLLFIRGRHMLSLICCALALPVQGQTGAYLLCAWWFACLIESRSRPSLRPALLVMLATGALALGAAWMRTTMGPVATDALGAVGRRLYPALIEPLTIIPRSWAGVVIILALGTLSWGALRRGDTGGAQIPDAQRRLLHWTLGALAFPLAGIVAESLGVEHPLLWRLMVGRSLMLVQIGALLACLLWSVRAMDASWPGAARATFVLGALVFWPLATLPEALAGALGAAAFACVGADLFERHARPLPAWPTLRPVVAMGALLAGVTIFGAVRFEGRTAPWTRRDAPRSWVEVQRWARNHTVPGSRFVTPPHLTGWRIGSHRPTYVEARDAGLLFYKDRAVLDWARRMEALGVDPRVGCVIRPDRLADARRGYARALAGGLDAIDRRTGADFVVCERADVPEGALVTWENEDYAVLDVRDDLSTLLARRSARDAARLRRETGIDRSAFSGRDDAQDTSAQEHPSGF